MNKKFLVIILICITLTAATCFQKVITAASPGEDIIIHIVEPGDTLYDIALMFNVPLTHLIESNDLNTTLIKPGQELIIPDIVTPVTARGKISDREVMLLARAIYAEARGESFAGQVAVGAVILNRVADSHFPNKIEEVIMQRNKHTTQFTPVADGSINLKPDQKAIRAAKTALAGNDPTRGALFFYNPRISSCDWITTLPVITRIGNHVFATTT